jgi:alpha,alpha-trehalase
MTGAHVLSAEKYDAVLFDLDGVITATDKVHYAAWKTLFDTYLKDVAEKRNEPFRSFEESDMSQYVDGRPRYEGVRSFLASRGISLPQGTPDDPEEAETICGLGNRKNRYFNEALQREGATVFESTVELIHTLRRVGIRCAVVSSSKNCETVLKVAGLTDLFDVRFDGTHTAELNLKGKPTPDTYLKAAEWLGVEPARAVVVEDAISGVQAGRAGRFGLVVGVDRFDISEALKENGADIVVRDMGELSVAEAER